MKNTLPFIALLFLALPAFAAEPEINPYLPIYPFKTAQVVVDKTEANVSPQRLVYSIKGNMVRMDIVTGMNAGSYELRTPEQTIFVTPKDKDFMARKSYAAFFHTFAQTLNEAQKKIVNDNIRKFGPHSPYYYYLSKNVGVLQSDTNKTFFGQPTACYDFSRKQDNGDAQFDTHCFWYGIELSSDETTMLAGHTGTTPALDKTFAVVKSITLDKPLDDALFAVPPDYKPWQGETGTIALKRDDALTGDNLQAVFEIIVKPGFDFNGIFVSRELNLPF